MTQDELDSYRAHIGRTLEENDSIAPEVVERFAAATNEAAPDRGGALPPLWHYGLFLPRKATAELGPDGHPPRGDFMPPVALPRRMFAGATVRFRAPLLAGQEATKVSRIASVDYREGKSGGLVFVRVEIAVRQRDRTCVEEEQTIVYRGDGAKLQPVVCRGLPAEAADAIVENWTPGPVELFRFSAVTFNAHRIHYDLPYAKEVEGYPALVVHGPLTAFRLCSFACRVLGGLKDFRFRGEAPLFADQPVRLIARREGSKCELAAKRCDGTVAMSASAAA
jgi:3-methylfumaryl-CoA hydratase